MCSRSSRSAAKRERRPLTSGWKVYVTWPPSASASRNSASQTAPTAAGSLSQRSGKQRPWPHQASCTQGRCSGDCHLSGKAAHCSSLPPGFVLSGERTGGRTRPWCAPNNSNVASLGLGATSTWSRIAHSVSRRSPPGLTLYCDRRKTELLPCDGGRPCGRARAH